MSGDALVRLGHQARPDVQSTDQRVLAFFLDAVGFAIGGDCQFHGATHLVINCRVLVEAAIHTPSASWHRGQDSGAWKSAGAAASLHFCRRSEQVAEDPVSGGDGRGEPVQRTLTLASSAHSALDSIHKHVGGNAGGVAHGEYAHHVAEQRSEGACRRAVGGDRC